MGGGVAAALGLRRGRAAVCCVGVGDLTALLLVQPFRQVDPHERGAGHKSASRSDFDATAWGMQFSTLNAYPSAVPVPKEIFAYALHAIPVAASITILVGEYVLLK